MAIVKASFTRSRAGAKASVRYMGHRPGKDGQRLTRELVGYDGTMKLIQAYEMIDEAGQGSLFYRLVISPDPRTEDAERDLHLREIIEKTMLYLEDRFQKAVPFVAAEHDDHSPHRHTHILAVLPGRLSPQDLAALRGVATEAALFQRQERNLAQARPIQGRLAMRSHRQAPRAEPRHSSRPSRQARGAGSRLVRGRPDTGRLCPRCGTLLGSRHRTCASCGFRLPRREGRGGGWER
jgi:hypothetical protein